jgi:hypothetical protein
MDNIPEVRNMDPEKINIKYKPNKTGSQVIAYCDEYPSLQGIGPSEGQATANFWKAFNKAEMMEVQEHNHQKKLEAEKKAA